MCWYFNTIVKFPVIPILFLYILYIFKTIYYVTRSNCPEVMRIIRLESHRTQLRVVISNNMKAGWMLGTYTIMELWQTGLYYTVGRYFYNISRIKYLNNRLWLKNRWKETPYYSRSFFAYNVGSLYYTLPGNVYRTQKTHVIYPS